MLPCVEVVLQRHGEPLPGDAGLPVSGESGLVVRSCCWLGFSLGFLASVYSVFWSLSVRCRVGSVSRLVPWRLVSVCSVTWSLSRRVGMCNLSSVRAGSEPGPTE